MDEDFDVQDELQQLAADICEGLAPDSGVEYAAGELGDDILPGWEVSPEARVQVVHLYGSSYGPPVDVEIERELGIEDEDIELGWLSDELKEEVDAQISAYARALDWLRDSTWYTMFEDNCLLFVRIFEKEEV